MTLEVEPKEWESLTVGGSVDLTTGFPFPSSRFSSSGIKLIRGSNVKRGHVDWSPDIARYWQRRELGLRSMELMLGDIVIAMDGALVGRSFARITRDDLPAYLVQRVARLRGRAIDQDLLYQWIGSRNFVEHVDNVKTNTAIPHISPGDIRDFSMLVPIAKSEQRAIAKALRDVDDLITSLNRLIVKKRSMKQGMMYELLTGRTRLPEFSGEWVSGRLGSVSMIKTGSRNNQDKDASGPYPFFVRSATVERIDTYSYNTEAILVPGEGGIGSIFHYINGKFEVHQRVYKISDFSPVVVGKFLYYYMRQFFGPHAMENSVKATVDSLRLPTINSFEFTRPPTRAEQTAIVEVLDNADAEIEVLQRRLEVTRAVKQGMLQELLSGRTRLAVKEDAA